MLKEMVQILHSDWNIVCNMNKTILSIHKWTGLISGLFLIIISTSGTILVFNKELNEKHLELKFGDISPDSSLVHLNFCLQQTLDNYPGYKIRVYFNENRGYFKFDIRGDKTKRFLYYQKTTGKLLLDINARELVDRFLLELHYTLFAGVPGVIIVFLVSICFFLSIISGVIVYRKSIFKALTFRKLKYGSSKKLWLNLHTTLAVWGLLFNLVMVFTGFLLILTVLDSRLSKKKTDSNLLPPTDLIRLAISLRGGYPDFTPYFCRIPADTSNPLVVYGKFTSTPFFYPDFSDRISYSGLTGELPPGSTVLSISDSDLKTRILILVYPLHFGDFGGFTLKILYSIFGLIPGVLGVTGFLIWMRKKRKKKIPSPMISERRDLG